MLNMTENFYESAVNRLIRPFFVFYALQPPVIPSVVEESRGNEPLDLFLSSCSLQCGGERWIVRSMSTRRREDCCLIFRKSFFNKDKSKLLKLQPSIVTRLLPRANSAQPRRQPFWLCEPFPLLGEFTPPLGESKTILFNSAVTLQRFREMKGRLFACSIWQKKKRLRATRIAVLLTCNQHYKAETRRM